jgi:hypothetical protein
MAALTNLIQPSNVATTNNNNTFTATQIFSGSASQLGLVVNDIIETVTISPAAATGTITYDITTQSVMYYTGAATANWTINIRASSTTTLNTALAVGQSISIAFLSTQGATAYYNNVLQVDGVTITPKWQGGVAPTAGNPNGIDMYTYTIVKTAASTYTVLGSMVRFV